MKQLCRVMASLLLVLSLAGCGGTGNTVDFTWFVEEIPTNLDPQLAHTSAEMITCNHLYTGLYQLDESGTPQPGCASEYTLSPDGRTYTFTIKPDLYYQSTKGDFTSYAITAEDFVFAFQRIFRQETHSPYVTSFAGIANSMAVLNGTMPESSLGVSAPNSHTLVIQLNSPDDSFLEKLTLPGAMPCDEEYFEGTGGTYGLTKKSSLSNGNFYLYNWTESGLFLRRKPKGDTINSLRLVTNTNPISTTPIQLVEGEKCSAILDEGTANTDLHKIPYSNTTWCLSFSSNSIFANTDLRQALAAAAQMAPLPKNTTLYGSAEGLIPTGARVDTLDYRDQAGPTIASFGDHQAIWQRALAQVPIAQLKGLSLLVPDTADSAFVQSLNGIWQKEYGLFCNIETVDAETFARRYEKGDYTIALAPVQLKVSDPTDMLAGLIAQYPAEAQSAFQDLILQAASNSGHTKLDYLAQAEQMLIYDAVLTPLYTQNARLLIDPAVEGLQFDPFGPSINVTWATSKE